MNKCECFCKHDNKYKDLYIELKQAICLLKSHIHTLKISEKLMSKKICKIVVPISTLALIKNLLFKNETICCDKCCNCNNNCKTNHNAHALFQHCYDNANKCCLKRIDVSSCAIYCNPQTYDVEKLCKKDICPIIDYNDDQEFLESIQLLIAKYDGFIHFFEKIISLIDGISS